MQGHFPRQSHAIISEKRTKMEKKKKHSARFPLAGLPWMGGGGALNGSDCALASSVSVFWLFWGLLLLTNAATADLLTQKFKICWIIKETFDSIHSTKGGCWIHSYLLSGFYFLPNVFEARARWIEDILTVLTRGCTSLWEPMTSRVLHTCCTRTFKRPKTFYPLANREAPGFFPPHPRVRTVLLRV